jgi:hypothetical protein
MRSGSLAVAGSKKRQEHRFTSIISEKLRIAALRVRYIIVSLPGSVWRR